MIGCACCAQGAGPITARGRRGQHLVGCAYGAKGDAAKSGLAVRAERAAQRGGIRP